MHSVMLLLHEYNHIKTTHRAKIQFIARILVHICVLDSIVNTLTKHLLKSL